MNNDTHDARTLEIEKKDDLEESPHWSQGSHTEQIPDHHVEIEVRASSLNLGFTQNVDRGCENTGPAKNLQSAGLAGTVYRISSRVKHVSVND